MQNKALSLYELNEKIRHELEALFPFPVWIVAEISEIQSRNHCYLELIERDGTDDKIIAKSRATIWARTFNLLRPYFETSTGYELSEGLKVLVQVEVQFSELYGLSLNVKDIDPNYTLGDLAQRKQQIIQQLKDEGIFEMNKALPFPNVPKTLAVISSEKAAGYQDFCHQLHQNSLGYQFHTQLFPALMQGEQAEASLISALERIYEYEEVFNAVVIIRGGGAVSDLSCFDGYELSANIAQFPLPILTGIGHDKDKSVADEVAFRALKTPTAVADFLLDCFQTCEDAVFDLSERFLALLKLQLDEQNRLLGQYADVLKYSLPASLKDNRQDLTNFARDLQFLVKERIAEAKSQGKRHEFDLQTAILQFIEGKKRKLLFVEQSTRHTSQYFFEKQQETLQHKERVVALLSPQKLLERGYSITTCNGKIVKNTEQLSKGSEIQTQFSRGKIASVVK